VDVVGVLMCELVMGDAGGDMAVVMEVVRSMRFVRIGTLHFNTRD
jgi:hypothetical protein